MIKVNELTKNYEGSKALDSLSINVKKGTIYGLIGPNGAGKTTLINHLNGIIKPESGSVKIKEEDVYENLKLKQKILSIADEWFYFSSYSIKQMAKFYKNIYSDFNQERYTKLKEIFNLDEKKRMSKLSKGQKKQVAFWLSLSAMPDVLVLDEPFDGLDPVIKKQILNLVIADVADREMTVLVSSHNLKELEDICDWIGIIEKGKLIIEKALDDLKGEVCKYQVSFKENVEDSLGNIDGLLKINKIGAVYNLIIKGDTNKVEEQLKKLNPLFTEKVALSLEEIFIYEMGGLGYDFENIIF